MAMNELRVTKRNQPVGQRWNSSAVFSIMWTVYCLGLLIYVGLNPNVCPYWFFYYFLRVLLLIPTYSLAYLWRIG